MDDMAFDAAWTTTMSTTTTPTKGTTTASRERATSSSQCSNTTAASLQTAAASNCGADQRGSLDFRHTDTSFGTCWYECETQMLEMSSEPARRSLVAMVAETDGLWHTSEELRAMRRKIEWYLTDANLCQDKTLHHKISQHLPEGWICCSELLCLAPLRDLNMTPSLLVRCLRKSHLETKVTLTSDELSRAKGEPGEFPNRGVYLRRRQPLPPLVSCDVLSAQVVVDPREFVLVDRHQTLNRLRDQARVLRRLHLTEVGDDHTVFQERILSNTCNYGFSVFGDTPVVLAIGYERVVYGDHGPYIEFSNSQLNWQAWPHYFDKRRYNSYFNEFYTKASHAQWEMKWKSWDPNPTKGLLLLYAQSRSVSDRPWAPGAGSDPHAGRPTGYADYRPGYFYVAADESLIIVNQQVQG